MTGKLLITGGAGFIGSHLLDRLAQSDYELVALDNFNDYYDPAIKRTNIAHLVETAGVRLVEGDIRDFDLLDRLFRSESFACVVHLAAMAGVRPSIENPRLYEQVNCAGTMNILEVVKKYNVAKFVFGSSSSVYGASHRIPFSEDDPCIEPISPYAATKRAGEIFCFNFHHLYGIPMVVLRFFTVYGPRQRPDMAIHKFTRMIDEGSRIPMFGDGSSKRDYTYIDDIIDGVTASIHLDCSFEILNLGNSHTVALIDLIRLIENKMGKAARIKTMPDQPGDVPITYADITRAAKLLNYKPKVDIETGITNFVQWYQNVKSQSI